VRLGQDVKKGDELCIIESPELGEAQADLLQKRVAKDSAGPVVDLAKASWDRAKGLYDQTQGTSLTEVQRREAEYKGAVAAQRAADAAVTASENRLHLLGMNQAAVDAFLKTGEVAPRYSIHAAIDGQVVQREVTLGELVSPDREAIMVLADLSNVWVLADVPEAKLAEIAVGAKAWVKVGSSDSKPLESQVAFISPMVDMTTRTAQVRIEVATKDLPLKPGMFAQVEIVTSTAAGAEPTPMVAVPDVAVQTVEGGPAIFVPVEGEPNTFAKRAVTIGKTVGGLVPIHSGLVEGERFVAAGTFILKADLGKGSAAHEH
jgi:cobalt-zinc-cadmium efflux system membrane fusion protein